MNGHLRLEARGCNDRLGPLVLNSSGPIIVETFVELERIEKLITAHHYFKE